MITAENLARGDNLKFVGASRRSAAASALYLLESIKDGSAFLSTTHDDDFIDSVRAELLAEQAKGESANHKVIDKLKRLVREYKL